MTTDRLAECRARLDGISEQPFDEQAAILEFVHEALTAELDELRRDHAQHGAPR